MGGRRQHRCVQSDRWVAVPGHRDRGASGPCLIGCEGDLRPYGTGLTCNSNINDCHAGVTRNAGIRELRRSPRPRLGIVGRTSGSVARAGVSLLLPWTALRRRSPTEVIGRKGTGPLNLSTAGRATRLDVDDVHDHSSGAGEDGMAPSCPPFPGRSQRQGEHWSEKVPAMSCR